jgi:hypothetical protein
MRKFVLILSVLYLVAVVAAFGYLSDWLNYPRALQESFVVIPLAVGAAAVLVVLVLAIGRPDILWDMLLLAAVLGSVGYVANENHNLYGSWWPDVVPMRTESSGEGTLRAHGEDISYRLELHHPGSLAHREYLVLRRAGREQRLRLPLFRDTRSGYVSAKQPSDWIVLRAGKEAEVFELETGRLLLVSMRLQVNLASGEVSALEPKPVAEVYRSPVKRR